MKQNNFYSYNLGNLSRGCSQCVKGEKTVLYITGLCPRNCFYCPLSEQKKNKDVMYANERKVKSIKEIIQEIKLNSSKGVGITGGDPLLSFNRTLRTIKSLKIEFPKFHIHLYTSLNLLDENKIKKLNEAGLDEIRLHPDLYDKSLWDKIKIIRKFRGKKGIEIPVIPGCTSKIKELVLLYEEYIDFLNLNEFEYSDSNDIELHNRGFYCRSKETYAIKGSREAAIQLLKWIEDNEINMRAHFCTAKLKDAIQISNRLKKRAKNVALPLDVVDEDGILIRGVIRSSDRKLMAQIKKKYEIPSNLITYDKDREQILIAPWILMEIFSEIDCECQIVKEYPTFDRMIVEVDVL